MLELKIALVIGFTCLALITDGRFASFCNGHS